MDHVFPLNNTGQATLIKVLKEFVTFVQTRYSCTVRTLRSDGEKGLGKDFDEWIKAEDLTF
jgi:hypothetical protein